MAVHPILLWIQSVRENRIYGGKFEGKSQLLFIAGNNRPTIKLLNKLVKKSVATKWYDLGIELLDDGNLQALDEIQKNNPRDASMCCTKMFQLWLERQPDASWRQLIQALREPNIELNELANTIEQKLISINEGKL